ncbi:MAG TPA: carboxylating nicotinate-nucleotide diphosphorylase [Planctomycetota bacterium]|nr:carboxylating nicotinate-nucleotide diphosphorylase [Planctomycetota bacterium]
MKLPVDHEEVQQLIRLAVEEDLGAGDVTTDAVVPAEVQARASVVARESGVVAGLPIIAPVLKAFAADAAVELKTHDGEAVSEGQVLAVMSGAARGLLSAERTVLNFLGRLSGIASLTRKFVDAVVGTPVRIYDTRKTTPGWRLLEKYAVRAGGGQNHRMGLYDAVLIKDNHLAVMVARGTPLTEAVARIRKTHPHITIEVEAALLEDVRRAADAGVDVILLDNMTSRELAEAVKTVTAASGGKRPVLEASGGVTLENVRAIAQSGVDRISVGALTHSAPALDLAVEFDMGKDTR